MESKTKERPIAQQNVTTNSDLGVASSNVSLQSRENLQDGSAILGTQEPVLEVAGGGPSSIGETRGRELECKILTDTNLRQGKSAQLENTEATQSQCSLISGKYLASDQSQGGDSSAPVPVAGVGPRGAEVPTEKGAKEGSVENLSQPRLSSTSTSETRPDYFPAPDFMLRNPTGRFLGEPWITDEEVAIETQQSVGVTKRKVGATEVEEMASNEAVAGTNMRTSAEAKAADICLEEVITQSKYRETLCNLAQTLDVAIKNDMEARSRPNQLLPFYDRRLTVGKADLMRKFLGGAVTYEGSPGDPSTEEFPRGEDSVQTYQDGDRIYKYESFIHEFVASPCRIPISSDRPHAMVCVEGVVDVKALIDLGATSSCIDQGLFEEILEKSNKPIKRLKRGVDVNGYGQNMIRNVPIVLLDIVIGNQKLLQEVPFLVYPNSTKLLLGCNVVKTAAISLLYDNERFMIRFESKPIHVDEVLVPGVEIRLAYSESDFQLLPGEIATINVGLPCQRGDRSWMEEDVIFNVQPGIQAVGYEGTLQKVKKHGNQVVVRNPTGHPLGISTDIPVAEVHLLAADHVGAVMDLADWRRNHDFFEKIPRVRGACYCVYTKTINTVAVFFTDFFGLTPFQHHVFDYRTENVWDVKKKSVVWNGDHLFIRAGKNQSHDNIQQQHLESMMPKHAKGKVYVFILSSGVPVTGEQKRIMKMLSEAGANIRIFVAKVGKTCYGCDTIMQTDLEEYMRHAEGFRLMIVDKAAEFPRFQRMGNVTHGCLSYRYLSNAVCLYRCDATIVVVVHLRPQLKEKIINMAFLFYSIIGHLVKKGCPPKAVILGLGAMDIRRSPIAIAITGSLTMMKNWKFETKKVTQILTGRKKVVRFEPRSCACESCIARQYSKSKPEVESTTIYDGLLAEHSIRQRVMRERDLDRFQGALVPSELDDLSVKVAELRGGEFPMFGPLAHRDIDTYEGLKKQVKVQEVNSPSEVSGESEEKGEAFEQYTLSQKDKDMADEVGESLAWQHTVCEDPPEGHYKSVDWRLFMDDANFPELVRAEMGKLLDEYQDLFSTDSSYWRPYNMKPVELKYKNNEIPRPKAHFQQNPEAISILDRKIDALIHNGTVKVCKCPFERAGSYSAFVVKYKEDHKEDSPLKLYRIVIDLRAANMCLDMPLTYLQLGLGLTI